MERGLPTDLGQPQMEGGEGAGFRASMGEISIWGTPPIPAWPRGNILFSKMIRVQRLIYGYRFNLTGKKLML